MARQKPSDIGPPLPPPATTLEGREAQLVDAAFHLAEKRINNETASAQEVVHFLRLGSVQSRLQNDKLKAENEVLKTRVKEMEGRRSGEELMSRALAAFKGYTGEIPIDPEADDDYSESY